MNPQDNANWPAWIGVILTALTLAWGALQWFLSSRFAEIEKRQSERHTENLTKFETLFDKMGDVGERVSKLEGRIEKTGRFPRIDR
jgi:hypothetical protein